MNCPRCNLDMLISHTVHKATGDSAPDTQTEMYAVPVFYCKNTNCTGYAQMLEGERIDLNRPTPTVSAGSLVSCCGLSLMTYTDDTFTMPQEIFDRSDTKTLESGAVQASCPKCGRLHGTPSGKRVRTM